MNVEGISNKTAATSTTGSNTDTAAGPAIPGQPTANDKENDKDSDSDGEGAEEVCFKLPVKLLGLKLFFCFVLTRAYFI